MRRALSPVLAALLGALLAGSAAAQEIARSPRPPANPVFLVPAPALPPAVVAADPGAASVALPAGGLAASLRPRPRPAAVSAKVEAVREASAAAAAGPDLLKVRPVARPEEDPQAAAEPAPRVKKRDRKKERETGSRKGSVCGVNAIKGERIATIRSKVKGCGLADGVRVTSVSGVRLSDPATIDCDTAKALNAWVEGVVQPAFRGDVVELRVAAHYICRSRNNIKGAKVSEHGRGKAIDISGLVLSSGKVLMVATDYRALRKVHKAACGIFGTTLGPGSDGFHEDHLHLDTAPNRSKPYCR